MSNTSNRSYPKPVNSNLVSADVDVLKQAFDMIDADVAAMLLQIAGKAASAHGHAMSDITGLAAALANKSAVGHNHALAGLSDVSGAADAPSYYVLYKTPTGWVPGSIASALVSALSLVAGDMLIVTSPGVLTRLPKGTNGQIMKMVGDLPAWATP